jgi:DNA-binding response OmpR family regulator
VLLVEDDTAIRTAVEVALRQEGWDVLALEDGLGVAAAADGMRPDAAILDVRLPHGPDGYELARWLRSKGDTPILFLTAASEVDARLEGFAAGGDDYLVKPFSMAELVARIHALLRRAGRLSAPVWRGGDIVFDRDARVATRGGMDLGLTRTEFDLLATFTAHPGKVLSKEQLLSQVWGFAEFDINLVEVHVSALRRKLERHGERVIYTVRGAGYVLRT